MIRALPAAVLLVLLAGCGGAPAVPSPSAAQPTIPPGAVKVIAVGDIACPPGEDPTEDSCQQAATARLAVDADPDRVITLGDLQYEDGTLKQFNNSYDDSWGQLKAVTRPLPGNHEYRTPGAAGYYDYWDLERPGYYAWNAGTWRIYNLNTNCGRIDCEREERWLRRDLRNHERRCSAIAMHHPRYSSGEEHGSDRTMNRFWKIALNHHVDIALAGHDHDYERFARMGYAGHRRKDGILSFVSGTGGKSLYSLGTQAPGSVYFQAAEFGVLVLWLGDGEFTWRFRDTSGDVRDSGNRSCV